jgi:hypothetical protein
VNRRWKRQTCGDGHVGDATGLATAAGTAGGTAGCTIMAGERRRSVGPAAEVLRYSHERSTRAAVNRCAGDVTEAVAVAGGAGGTVEYVGESGERQ